jgi:nucleotide-binding universal stress UspA family protein
MTTSDSPVEIAGVKESARAVSEHPYAHIVVALDGSALAERVLNYVDPLAKAFGSRVTCVCAVEPISTAWTAGSGVPDAYVPIEPLLETEEEIRDEDVTYLARVKQRLANDGIEVDTEEPEGRAAEAIVASARKHQTDVIAMTTHGRSGLGRALLGSVADEVVRTAPCAVLLVRIMTQS